MKRMLLRYFIAAAVSSMLLPAQDRPVVQVDPVVNLSGHPLVDDLCGIITDQIYRTLILLGRYEVLREQPDEDLLYTGAGDPEILKERSLKEGYDNILSGGISMEGDRFIISILTYGLSENRMLQMEPETADDIFLTRNAADRIIEKTLEEFSGHVNYGRLRILLPETGEPMEFTLDGLTDNALVWERFPEGTHEAVIIQERSGGITERNVSFEVEADRENTLELKPFYLTPEEETFLNRVDAALIQAAREGSAEKVPELVELDTLLSDPLIRDYRPGLVEKYSQWRDQLYGNGKTAPVEPRDIRLSRKFYWPIPVGTVTRDIQLSSRYSQPVGSDLIPIRTINLDGEDDDWEGITTRFSDPEGDMKAEPYNGIHKAEDIVELAVCVDREFLYLMLRTADGEYNNSEIWQKFNISSLEDSAVAIRLMDQGVPVIADRYRYVGGPDTDWPTLAIRIGYQTEEVMEIAIPLTLLVEDGRLNHVVNIENFELNDHDFARNDFRVLDDIRLPILYIPLLELLLTDEKISQD